MLLQCIPIFSELSAKCISDQYWSVMPKCTLRIIKWWFCLTYWSVCFRSQTWLIVTQCTQEAAAATGLSCSLMRLKMNCKMSGRRLALPLRCWVWVESDLLWKHLTCHCKTQTHRHTHTQTHNVSRIWNSIEQTCLILMCCNVYYETSVKCQVVVHWLIGNEKLYSQQSTCHQWWAVVVRCHVYTPATWKVLDYVVS
jgi:hypothetical protein